MEENNLESDSLKIKGVSPLRGSVPLQADVSLTNFLITLSIILNKKISLKADFLNPEVADYVHLLNNYGLSIHSYGDSAFIHGDLTVNESFVLSSNKLYEKYIILLVLSKRGYINLSEDKEFVDFFSYLGFLCKKDLNGTLIYNKVSRKKSTITFYSFNYDYILLSILSLLLNNTSFTLFLPDINPPLKMLFSLLKDIGFIENIVYGKFVGVYFNADKIDDSIEELEVPKDYKEFLFFSVASLITGGDIEFKGINTSYLANSLKILSNFGISYDVFEEERIRLWFSDWPKEPFSNIKDVGASTSVVRLFMLPVLPKLPEEHLPKSINISLKERKKLIQDLNSLGCGLEIPQEDTILVKRPGNFRRNNLYLLNNHEEGNYTRFLGSLLPQEGSTLYNVNALLNYNSSLLEKLSNLGLNFENAS